MNLLNVHHWVSILVCSLFITLSACKNTPDETDSLLHIAIAQSVWAEGDTVGLQLMLNNEPISAESWTTTLGTINNEGKWIAPTHIELDTIRCTIAAFYKKKQGRVLIKVTKKAFQQPTISYAQTIQPLLTNNCNFSGCHANGSRGGKVELSVYDSVKKSVLPFNANASKLYFSLIKTDPLRVMPPAGKLHPNKIQSVWLWIEQGAQNN